MARTIAQIYDELIVEKNGWPTLNGLAPSVDDAQTLLNDVQTPSRVAEWRLWLFIVSVGIWIHEKLWDVFKALIESLLDAKEPGTMQWLVTKAKEFQLGYSLLWLNNKYQYDDTTSPAAVASRIVAVAAGVASGGQVRIKAAKNIGGVVTPMSGAERSALDFYLHEISSPGINLSVISNAGDDLHLQLTVSYDPLVLANDGSLLSNSAVFPVEDAINNYIHNLPFNGKLVPTYLVDALQLVQGVTNPVITLIEAKYGALPYAAVGIGYLPDAGYLVIDPAFPLNTSITYVPNV